MAETEISWQRACLQKLKASGILMKMNEAFFPGNRKDRRS